MKTVVIYILGLTVILLSCSDTKRKSINTNEQLEKGLNITNVININYYKIEPIIIEPDLIIDDKFIKTTHENKEIFLAAPFSCIMDKNNFYIVDRSLCSIIQLDRNGNYIKSIGRKGRGPGEFIEPVAILKSKLHYYLFDSGNSRIQIFDTTFNYQNSIPASFMPFMQNISSNENTLLVPTERFNIIDGYQLNSITASTIQEDTTFYFPYATHYLDNRELSHSMRAVFINNNMICNFYHSFEYLYIENINEKKITKIVFESENIDRSNRNKFDDEQNGIAMIIKDVDVVDSTKIIVSIGENLILLRYSNFDFIVDKVYKIHEQYSVTSIDISEGYLFTYEWSKARVLGFKIINGNL